MTLQTMTSGYARMGRREVKKALEAYWSGSVDAMPSTVRDMEAHGWKPQLAAGVDPLPISWINPSCALKTRRWEAVIPALKNRVAATQKFREEIDAAIY